MHIKFIKIEKSFYPFICSFIYSLFQRKILVLVLTRTVWNPLNMPLNFSLQKKKEKSTGILQFLSSFNAAFFSLKINDTSTHLCIFLCIIEFTSSELLKPLTLL